MKKAKRKQRVKHVAVIRGKKRPAKKATKARTKKVASAETTRKVVRKKVRKSAPRRFKVFVTGYRGDETVVRRHGMFVNEGTRMTDVANRLVKGLDPGKAKFSRYDSNDETEFVHAATLAKRGDDIFIELPPATFTVSVAVETGEGVSEAREFTVTDGDLFSRLLEIDKAVAALAQAHNTTAEGIEFDVQGAGPQYHDDMMEDGDIITVRLKKTEQAERAADVRVHLTVADSGHEIVERHEVAVPAGAVASGLSQHDDAFASYLAGSGFRADQMTFALKNHTVGGQPLPLTATAELTDGDDLVASPPAEKTTEPPNASKESGEAEQT